MLLAQNFKRKCIRESIVIWNKEAKLCSACTCDKAMENHRRGLLTRSITECYSKIYRQAFPLTKYKGKIDCSEANLLIRIQGMHWRTNPISGFPNNNTERRQANNFESRTTRQDN